MIKAIKEQKLAAFTLIELMVSMLISSIAIGLIYSGYEIVSKQYRSYKQTNEIIAEAVYLNSIMNKDFSKARDAKRNDSSIELIDYNNNVTIYELTEENIIRKVSFSVDTFRVPVQNIGYSMLGEDLLLESGWIDELVFDVKVNKEVNAFHFKKSYDAAFLMEREDQFLGN